MPWGRIDDSLYDHRKVEALPDAIRLACVGLQALAISWCNRQLTDGFVPANRIAKLHGTRRHRDALVAVEMWDEAPGGIQIHNFLRYNRSRAQVIAEREAARARMEQKRHGSREVRPNTDGPFAGSSGEQQPNNGASSGERSRTPASGRESRPDPSRESLQRESLPSARPAERADVQALLDRGWKRVTKAQRAVLDEVLDRHDVTGAEFAAEVIRATGPERDPLAEVLTADAAWQGRERRRADAEGNEWEATKARERAEAAARAAEAPTWLQPPGERVEA